jgi:hypothetical protein
VKKYGLNLLKHWKSGIYFFVFALNGGMAAHTDAFSGRLAAMHSYPILFNSEQPSHKFGARL